MVEELENYSGKDMLFIEPKRTEEEYPIPAAFQLTQPIFRSDSDRKNMTKNKTETCMEVKT